MNDKRIAGLKVIMGQLSLLYVRRFITTNKIFQLRLGAPVRNLFVNNMWFSEDRSENGAMAGPCYTRT